MPRTPKPRNPHLERQEPLHTYTANELARLWGVTERTVRSWIAAGKLKAIKLGGRTLRVRAAEAEAFLKRAEQGRA